SVLWREPSLQEEGERLLERLPVLIAQDEALDLLAGAAGCIGGLLCLDQCGPSPRAVAAAQQCGERLLARAQRTADGIGWLFPEIADVPLTGFAHGNAGFAWALLRLAARTGEERFHRAALDALDHERAQFVPNAGNWA